jgi:hypothetical protein
MLIADIIKSSGMDRKQAAIDRKVAENDRKNLEKLERCNYT